VATQGRIKKALNAANAAPARGGRTALIDVICKGQISLVGPIRHTPTLLDLVEEPLDEIMRAIQASKSALFDFVSAECWPTRHTLRQTRGQLSRLRQTGGYPQSGYALMSPQP
jgi:hypothetical protein